MLHLEVAERIETLTDHLAGVLLDAPGDPMTPEWIAVPSAGMRRWLHLELAARLGASATNPGSPRRRDGIAANIDAVFPGSLRQQVLEADRLDGESDPWRVDHLVWALLEVADRHPGQAAIASLTPGAGGGSRYGRARRVADLFDRYHLHRPAMIRSWAEGADVGGTGSELVTHHRWQPELWRLVRAHLAVASPPERMPELLERIASGRLALDLPERLTFFGMTVLPGGRGFLDLATALAVDRELYLLLLQPSIAAVDAVRVAATRSGATPSVLRADDPTSDLIRHPLLKSWGRPHRETALLTAGEEIEVTRSEYPADTEGGSGVVPLLAALRDDIRLNRAPAGDRQIDDLDRSVQFHSCHGSTRQVEVLRDAILHALADDPTLSEDDIVVCCPALERFAPLVEGVFGPSTDAVSGGASAVGAEGPPPLRYRIADRSLRNTNPYLGAVAALTELVTGRFDATSVLGFLALMPVRQRFRLTDDDLALIGEWVSETYVRWGLDSAHRDSFEVTGTTENNSWRGAIDRLLLGSAISDIDDLALSVGDVAAYGIEGDATSLAGRLAEVMWRLTTLSVAVRYERTIGDWVDLLTEAADTLFDVPVDVAWQPDALTIALHEITEQSSTGTDASSTSLSFDDVRALLGERLRGAPGRPDFFRGGVTITSMVPLRWVPHRVVILLGMDQASLSGGWADGDDLAAFAPFIGDRDPRGEARQSLLEAVLAVDQRLIIIRDGRDVRTNQEIPHAVAVAELRDAVLAMFVDESRKAAAALLETNHPRQAFDERNFRVAESTPTIADQPWSFDPLGLAGASARQCREPAAAPFLDRPLDPRPTDVIELRALHAFLKHPVKAFLVERLGLRLPRTDDALSVLLPTTLAGLDRWRVGDRLLRAMLDDVDVDEWRRIEDHMGTLPPGLLGDAKAAEVETVATELLTTAVARGLQTGRSGTNEVEVDVELADGTRIVGSVSCRLEGDELGPASVSFSNGKPEHRIAVWLDLMALVAGDPSNHWRSLAVNRTSGSKKLTVLDFVPSTDAPAERQSLALEALAVAVDCYRRGLREPIPLFPRCSRAIALGKPSEKDWNSNNMTGDGLDQAVRAVFGDIDFEDVLNLPGQADDPMGNGATQRAQRFAHHLWDTLERSIVDLAVPGAGAKATGRAKSVPR